ncbi:MAG TPA: hypothetical protein VF403_04560 [Kofleriaceae bacterium]
MMPFFVERHALEEPPEEVLLVVVPLPSEIELLEIQYEGTFDRRSRIGNFYGVTIAVSAGRQSSRSTAEP